SINSYNRNQKHQEVAYTDQRKNTEDDGGGTDREDGEQNPKVRKLLKAMDELKENYRIALTLHLVEGYDHEQLCEILDLSYANCRTTISRAKESRRKKMEVL